MGGYYTPPPGGGSGGAAGSLQTTGAPVVVSTAIPPSPGQVLTAVSATEADWETPGASTGALVLTRAVLTGSQLAAINTVPVTVIAAPGANRMIGALTPSPNSAVFLTAQTTAGATPFVTYGDLRIILVYGSSSTGDQFAGDALNINERLGADHVFSDEFSQASGNNPKASYNNQLISATGSDDSTGRITASNVQAGHAGTLFAPGDTFDVTEGGLDATGVVDTVDGLGAVQTFHIVDKGTGYLVSSDNSTSATSGLGIGLRLQITAIQSVSGGDGKLILNIPTVVLTLE